MSSWILIANKKKASRDAGFCSNKPGERIMKKRVFLIILGLALLAACGQKKIENQDNTPDSSKRTLDKEQKSSSISVEQDEKLYASTLDKLTKDTSEGRAQIYTFYDIDKNGTNELITGHHSDGAYYLAAIYYLNQGTSTYLAQSKVASAGGSRESATIYTDGTVFYAQWHSLSPDAKGYLYRLRSDNSGIDVLKEADFQIAGVDSNSEKSVDSVFGLASKKEVDLASLTWKDIESYKSISSVGAEDNPEISTQMDLSSIQNGDFSSIEGTWKNENGEELTFDKNGLVTNGLKLGNQFKIVNSYLEGGVSYGGPGAAILFIPAGVDMSMTLDNQKIMDASNRKRDRILITQSVNVNNSEVFYYKE